MKLIFFGTSAFAGRVFEDLLKSGVEICAVVTKPDKPKGRSLLMTPPPVKESVQKLAPHIPIYQPIKASTPEFGEILKSYHADIFVVVAYGEIIKKNLLEMPPLGCINIHASLLPKYRGATPIVRCLMNGETETGITIMDMVLEMDAGAILKTANVSVPASMLFGELEEVLSEVATPALLEVLKGKVEGTLQPISQEHALATFAPKLVPAEEEISWDKAAFQIHNLIRALSPRPGAWCWVQIGSEKKRLKIKRSEIVLGLCGKPGENLILNKEEWVVACGKEALRLLEIQLEGKKSMPTKDFLRGSNTPLKFLIDSHSP